MAIRWIDRRSPKYSGSRYPFHGISTNRRFHGRIAGGILELQDANTRDWVVLAEAELLLAEAELLLSEAVLVLSEAIFEQEQEYELIAKDN